MRALRDRFNGNRREVVEYARLWGISKCMERYGVRDYIAMQKYLETETGDPNFGIQPVFNPSIANDWANKLLDAFLNKVQELEAQNTRLKDTITTLNNKIEYIEASNTLIIEPKITEVMKAVKE